MSSNPYPYLLWTARDHENDLGELRRAAPADPVYADADVLGVLRVNGSGFDLDTGTARGLRDALNVLLVDDAGVDVEPMVMHEAQHHAVQRQALRIGRDVAEQAADLVRLASKAAASTRPRRRPRTLGRWPSSCGWSRCSSRGRRLSSATSPP
jgi:hypothetical protein